MSVKAEFMEELLNYVYSEDGGLLKVLMLNFIFLRSS